MRIKNIHIENFRGLIDEYVEFNGSMTVLAGGNGGGKSSLLEAVSIMLSWLPAGISNSHAAPLKIKSSDVSYGKTFARLKMTLTEAGKDINLTLTKRADKRRGGKASNMSAAKKYASDMRVLLDSPDGADVEIPVFAYYGTGRNFTGTVSPVPSESTDRTSVYKKAFDAGTDFGKLAKWLALEIDGRSREMEEASRLPLRAANRRREAINAKYSALAAVKKALCDFSVVFKGLETRGGELFIPSKNIPACALSDGEKTVASLIADIAMRMAVANPRMRNPLESSAIVLVDELDLHLHPDWQVAVAERLPRIFVGAQFIISSHSPSIMAYSKSLYKISGEGDGQKILKVESPYGRNPSDMLSNLLNSPRPPDASEKISKMYAMIDARDFAGARKTIEELNALIPDDPEIVRAEYLVRALSREAQ